MDGSFVCVSVFMSIIPVWHLLCCTDAAPDLAVGLHTLPHPPHSFN